MTRHPGQRLAHRIWRRWVGCGAWVARTKARRRETGAHAGRRQKGRGGALGERSRAPGQAGGGRARRRLPRRPAMDSDREPTRPTRLHTTIPSGFGRACASEPGRPSSVPDSDGLARAPWRAGPTRRAVTRSGAPARVGPTRCMGETARDLLTRAVRVADSDLLTRSGGASGVAAAPIPPTAHPWPRPHQTTHKALAS